MWEPRELPRLREDARATARVPTSNLKPETQHQIRQESRVRSGDIPPELLVLVRFGVTYPFIKTAWRLSQTHGIDGGEILVRARIITNDIWLASQKLLADERRAAKAARQQRTYLLDQAIHNLWRRLPHYSAAHTWTLPQLIVFNLALITTLILIFLGFESVVYGLFLGISIFYTAGILLRAFILAWFDNRVRGNNSHLLKLPETLPIYSITVPLYHEANQVHDLVEHLKLIDWPEDRLDIKLICEQDDSETIQALSELVLPNSFEIILVPPCNPRTKPKALNYALPLCRGEFLVIYDAEDRPSPGQLREAFATFKTSDPNLACLQAPLVIHNSKQNWLTSMFAIEYNTLFRGILPVLAKWQVPLPLGGTSNHFNGVMYQTHQGSTND